MRSTLFKAASSLMSRDDVTERGKVAVEEEIASVSGEIRKAECRRVRPLPRNAGAVTTASSCDTAADRCGAMGACRAGPRPTSRARSQVGNGAVNGAMTSTTSQQAVMRENIDVVATRSSKLRATRRRRSARTFQENGRIGATACTTRMSIEQRATTLMSASMIRNRVHRARRKTPTDNNVAV